MAVCRFHLFPLRLILVVALSGLSSVGWIPRTALADKPIALHPENPHYFLWRDKPTILVTSGEHYGAVLNLDFDFDRYLATLAADGLNHTRTFSGTYREDPTSFKITDNTLAPKPNRYCAPWARSDSPGYFDGGNKFDLTKWDEEYFQRMRRFLSSARKHGVVVEITLFCPLYREEMWAASPMNVKNNVNGVGDCRRDESLSLKHPQLVEVQTEFVRKIVRELNEFDNLYFEICNEPYVRKVPDDWQYRMIDVVVETERSLPNQHLISLNISNGRRKVENPHGAVSIFNFHYCVPPDTVALNFGLNKVIGENETGFRGRHDFLYRSEGWDFLLAGGGLYNNLDYSFTPAYPAGDFLDYQSPGGGSPDLRRQLGILKRFLDGLPLLRMKPNDAVIRSISGGLEGRVLAEPGKAYAIYVRVPIPHKPKRIEEHLRDEIEVKLVVDLLPGHYRAEWVSTSTGTIEGVEQWNHSGGEREMRSPKFANDVALRILSTDASK
ncbi:MAG: hypothetical protein AB7O26_09930 [Planctomycetaceae bacterium]